MSRISVLRQLFIVFAVFALSVSLLVACTLSSSNASDETDSTLTPSNETTDDVGNSLEGSNAASKKPTAASLQDAGIGDTVCLGEFGFQANALSSGSTESRDDFLWEVLDIKDGKVLLISKEVIDLRSYHNEAEDITWEDSSIRAWLNGDFYESLPADIRERIVKTELANDDNPSRGTRGGNNTEDNIFLLSIDEVNSYFSSDSARQANINLTQTTIERVNTECSFDLEKYAQEHNGFDWWLRSPGFNSVFAAYVDRDGRISEMGDIVLGVSGAGEFGLYIVYNFLGVRPAFWLAL